jgi:tetratricopeptide (TPR) repeat protein
MADAKEIVEVKKKEGAGFDSELALGNLQNWFDKNKKTAGILAAVVIAVVGVFAYFKFSYLPSQNAEAEKEILVAANLFEKDSFKLALNGGKFENVSFRGVRDIADEYSWTKTGNLANYYAGIASLQLGEFENAIEYLNKFKSDDVMLGSVAIGAIGDANMELNRADEAIKYYKKAADKNVNDFTTPLYLKKAALAEEGKSNFAEALKIYERILVEFNKSTEARDIEKYIERAKSLGNIQ